MPKDDVLFLRISFLFFFFKLKQTYFWSKRILDAYKYFRVILYTYLILQIARRNLF